MSWPCYFCNSLVGDEFYCFGCHYHICDKCDGDEWPPAEHTRPEQHDLKTPHKKVKMSKTEEIAHLKNALQIQQANYNQLYDRKVKDSQYWAGELAKTKTESQKTLADLTAKHREAILKLGEAATDAIREQKIVAERDSAINAFKYLAECVTNPAKQS